MVVRLNVSKARNGSRWRNASNEQKVMSKLSLMRNNYKKKIGKLQSILSVKSKSLYELSRLIRRLISEGVIKEELLSDYSYHTVAEYYEYNNSHQKLGGYHSEPKSYAKGGEMGGLHPVKGNSPIPQVGEDNALDDETPTSEITERLGSVRVGEVGGFLICECGHEIIGSFDFYHSNRVDDALIITNPKKECNFCGCMNPKPKKALADRKNSRGVGE